MSKELLDEIFREIEKDYPLGNDPGYALLKAWPNRWKAIKIELLKLLPKEE